MNRLAAAKVAIAKIAEGPPNGQSGACALLTRRRRLWAGQPVHSLRIPSGTAPSAAAGSLVGVPVLCRVARMHSRDRGAAEGRLTQPCLTGHAPEGVQRRASHRPAVRTAAYIM
jgi:hypothetical protein